MIRVKGPTKSSAAPVAAELSEQERRALITLLADEDPYVYERVREKIVASGPGAVQWLKPHLVSSDPLVRRRARAITQLFERHTADNDFTLFCLTSGNDLDLEYGALLLSRTAYPDVNIHGYSALLDNYAAELRSRLAHSTTAGEILMCLRKYVFGELRFVGNRENEMDRRNGYLSRVMDRRIGNSITLCTLYLVLARRLNLPVTGIALPWHFLCRYQNSSVEVYIDAFDRGKLLSKADCARFLVWPGQKSSEWSLSPVSTRQMLLRMCTNLYQMHIVSRDSEEAKRLMRYVVALSKQGP